MLAVTTSHFNATPDTVWQLLERSDTLVYITRGVINFQQAAEFPTHWSEGYSVRTDLTVLRIATIPDYEISFVRIDPMTREIETREGGGDVQQWDHRMTITASADGTTCWYTDEVEVAAGARTWVVWLFAKLVYRYRHVRWRKLLQQQHRS